MRLVPLVFAAMLAACECSPSGPDGGDCAVGYESFSGRCIRSCPAACPNTNAGGCGSLASCSNSLTPSDRCAYTPVADGTLCTTDAAEPGTCAQGACFEGAGTGGGSGGGSGGGATGGGATGGGMGGGGAVAQCSGAADCDDQNPCTQDSCDAGACVHALQHDHLGAVTTPVLSPTLDQQGAALSPVQIAFDGQNFLLVWSAANATFARRFDSAGQWVDTQALSMPAHTDLFAFGTDRYAIVGDQLGNPVYGIVGAELSASGATLAGPYTIASGVQGNPDALGALAFGGTRWLVVYTQGRTIFSKTLATGGSIGAENPLNAPSGYANGVTVTAGVDGGFLTAWMDYRDLSNAASVYVAKVSNSGVGGPAVPVNVITMDTMACIGVFPVTGASSYLVFYRCSDGVSVRTLSGDLSTVGPALTASFSANPQPGFDSANFGLLKGSGFVRYDAQGNLLDATPVPLWPPSGANALVLGSDRKGRWATAEAYASGADAGISVRLFSTCP